MKKIIENHRWKILFGLWSMQGIAALFWIWLIPADAENGVFLGFTPARLMLIGLTFVLTIVSGILFFYEKLSVRIWFDVDRYTGLWDFLYILALIILFVSPTLIYILHSLQNGPQYTAYAERLTPLAIWLGLSSLELIGLIVSFRREQVVSLFNDFKSIRKIILINLLLILVIVLVVIATGIGITPDINMGAPAIPVFEWQIILILIVLVVFTFLPTRIYISIDRWAVLCIYVFTVVIWLSQPVNTAYTATPPRAPNFEIYPFSDPQIYSQYAQSALVGNGFLYPDVPSRPLYIAFLTWFHLLGNQDYNQVIVIQSLLLAFFPVMLYLIGKELGGRALGFGMAIIAAFRDVNANIAVPFASNVTYSKLFLSEIPLALFIGIFTFITTRWLKRDQRSIWLPLLAGGLLGTATLIRTQSVGLVGVILLFAYLVIPDRKLWLKRVFALVFALLLTILPWLVRNYAATGGLVLDNPVSQVMTMARRWNGNWGNEILSRYAGESDAEYSNRMMQVAIVAFKQTPQFILGTAANHFINSEIASLMVFPIRDEIRSPTELLLPQHAFWSTTIRKNQLPILFLYTIFFVLGIAIAFRRCGWVGLLPLGLGLVYNAWTALFFSSGERFVVPLDWSFYLYQLLGLISLGALVLAFTRGAFENASSWIQELRDVHSTVQYHPSSSRRNIVFIFVVILAMGAFIPFTEFVFPQKYIPVSQEDVEQRIGLTVNEEEAVVYGRAIYPRYYYSGEGEPETEKLGYRVSKQARLIFFVVGSQNGLVVFKLQDVPEFFPHASDVYMIGNWINGYFSPRAVLVSKDGQSMRYQIR